MKTQVKETLAKVTKMAHAFYGDRLEMPKFNITYDLKSVRTLGSVKKNRATGTVNMRLNPHLLEEFGEKYIEHVVVHELAHIITDGVYPFNKYGRIKSHGREFKSVCYNIGYGHVGKATTGIFSESKHLQSTRTAKPKKTFTYTCGCGDHPLTQIRHGKVLRGASYRCGRCKTTLVRKA